MAEHIVFDGPTGLPIVSSTGTRVDDILDAIDSTGSVDGALQRFPGLTTEGVSAALQFARQVSQAEAAILAAREDVNATATTERRSVEDSLKAAEARREQLLYELDVVESIRDGLQDIIDGNTISHEEAKAYMRARIPGLGRAGEIAREDVRPALSVRCSKDSAGRT